MAHSQPEDVGPLLRQFRSELFGVFSIVVQLYRSDKIGVHDFLCNELYSKPEDEVEFYLPQLWCEQLYI